MKPVIATITLMAAGLLVCEYASSPAAAQTTTVNKNKSVKGETKASGKEVGKAGTSLGSNVKHGRVARGGKHFGQHMYRAGKHFGKGTGRAAKKTGRAVKNAAKP